MEGSGRRVAVVRLLQEAGIVVGAYLAYEGVRRLVVGDSHDAFGHAFNIVRLEQEMGIFFEQWNHPAVIGMVTGAASVLGGLVVAGAALTSPWWLPIAATAGVLALAAMARTGWARPATVESFARWAIVAGGVAGTAFFLSKLITGSAS